MVTNTPLAMKRVASKPKASGTPGGRGACMCAVRSWMLEYLSLSGG